VTPKWTGKVNQNQAGDQYGGDPVPGIVIAQQNGDDPQLCTLGTAVRTTDDNPAFVTAGHCDVHPGNPLQLYPSADISGDDARVLPSPFARKEDTDGKPDPKTGVASDSALVPLTGTLPDDATVIAGRYRVAGVLTTDAVRNLPPRTPICFDGAMSGVHCGEVAQADDQGALRFRPAGGASDGTVFIRKGDSGAPLFVLDADNHAALVGILSSGTKSGDIGWATYLEPALQRLHVQALLNPSVPALNGDDFSTDYVTVQ
jgi:hypothetical protein